MFKDYPDVMTVTQAAKALGIGRNTAYKLVNSRALGHKRIGSRILIPKCCLIDFVKSARYQTQPL